MEQLGSYWTDFYDIWYLNVFLKSVEKIQVLLKSENSIGYFIWRPLDFLITSRSVLLKMRNVLHKSCKENPNTHFIFSNFFFFENRAVCEIRWKNIVVPGRPQISIRLMRIACWIPKATNTFSECVIFIAFPLQQWMYERIKFDVGDFYENQSRKSKFG
jgi:hypothetical protein